MSHFPIKNTSFAALRLAMTVDNDTDVILRSNEPDGHILSVGNGNNDAIERIVGEGNDKNNLCEHWGKRQKLDISISHPFPSKYNESNKRYDSDREHLYVKITNIVEKIQMTC